MTSIGPWLLVVVEGPSEARSSRNGDEHGGVVLKIVEQAFGQECARERASCAGAM